MGDGEYKASAKVKVDAPEGDVSTDIPSADAFVAVKSPEIDLKPVKVSGKSKSKGLSCFGKPKGAELDGEYKASTDVKTSKPDLDLVSVDTPDIDAGLSMPKYGIGGSLSDIGAFGVDVDTDVKVEAPQG